MCHLTFAQSKTKLKLQKRELFNCLGETSTHCCSYSGVPVRPTSELPMIAANDKPKLLGISKSLPEVPLKWSAKHGAVIPAFWCESKPISFWRALLQDVGVTHVFDLTSGSGALLEASLANGIHYHEMVWPLRSRVAALLALLPTVTLLLPKALELAALSTPADTVVAPE